MLPFVCSVIDHRRRQNEVRTSETHSAIASYATFLFLSHFDVICDLLLNRRPATWNLVVKYTLLRQIIKFTAPNLQYLCGVRIRFKILRFGVLHHYWLLFRFLSSGLFVLEIFTPLYLPLNRVFFCLPCCFVANLVGFVLFVCFPS